MSHSSGQVKFPDGLIMHFEYDGTCDIAINHLYDTAEEMHENWRAKNRRNGCTCKKDEPVEIAASYGDGTEWTGKACRTCKAFTEGTFYEFDTNFISDGLPDWWEKPVSNKSDE